MIFYPKFFDMIRYKCFEKPPSAKIKNNVLTRKLRGEVAVIQKNLIFFTSI